MDIESGPHTEIIEDFKTTMHEEGAASAMADLVADTTPNERAAVVTEVAESLSPDEISRQTKRELAIAAFRNKFARRISARYTVSAVRHERAARSGRSGQD